MTLTYLRDSVTEKENVNVRVLLGTYEALRESSFISLMCIPKLVDRRQFILSHVLSSPVNTSYLDEGVNNNIKMNSLATRHDMRKISRSMTFTEESMILDSYGVQEMLLKSREMVYDVARDVDAKLFESFVSLAATNVQASAGDPSVLPGLSQLSEEDMYRLEKALDDVNARTMFFPRIATDSVSTSGGSRAYCVFCHSSLKSVLRTKLPNFKEVASYSNAANDAIGSVEFGQFGMFRFFVSNNESMRPTADGVAKMLVFSENNQVIGMQRGTFLNNGMRYMAPVTEYNQGLTGQLEISDCGLTETNTSGAVSKVVNCRVYFSAAINNPLGTATLLFGLSDTPTTTVSVNNKNTSTASSPIDIDVSKNDAVVKEIKDNKKTTK
jgi:hypothetical protein